MIKFLEDKEFQIFKYLIDKFGNNKEANCNIHFHLIDFMKKVVPFTTGSSIEITKTTFLFERTIWIVIFFKIFLIVKLICLTDRKQ